MNNRDSSQPQFPEVIVVEASAGSGKTYALAKRYVQLLLNSTSTQAGIPLRIILAITFTNKATIEMKERILELLKKIALDCFASKEEEQDILGLMGPDRERAQKVAHQIMDEIIRHYNYFGVQTIDSFINALEWYPPASQAVFFQKTRRGKDHIRQLRRWIHEQVYRHHEVQLLQRFHPFQRIQSDTGNGVTSLEPHPLDWIRIFGKYLFEGQVCLRPPDKFVQRTVPISPYSFLIVFR